MRWKLFTAAALGALLIFAPAYGNVHAADYTAYEEYEKAIGLIEKCTLTCSSTEGGVIYITAKTQVSSTMGEVGYKNITVQHSDDGKNWTDEQVLNDITGKNVRYYNIDNLRVQTRGSGYYRVICVHYAKGIPFGDTAEQIQTAINVSAVAYVNQPATAPPKPTQTTTSGTTTSTTSTRRTTTTTVSKTTSKTASGTTAKSGTSVTSSTGKSGTSAEQTSITTAAAVTSAKSEPAKPTNSPNTGAKAPTGAAVILTAAGTAVWFMRKKKQ